MIQAIQRKTLLHILYTRPIPCPICFEICRPRMVYMRLTSYWRTHGLGRKKSTWHLMHCPGPGTYQRRNFCTLSVLCRIQIPLDNMSTVRQNRRLLPGTCQGRNSCTQCWYSDTTFLLNKTCSWPRTLCFQPGTCQRRTADTARP